MNILQPTPVQIHAALRHFRLMKHVFYVDTAKGNLELFTESTCPCGRLCRDANSVIFTQTDKASLLIHGLKESQTTNEGAVTENGDDCCEECYGEKAA